MIKKSKDMDDAFKTALDVLVKKGFAEVFVENGEERVKLTSLGRQFAEATSKSPAGSA